VARARNLKPKFFTNDRLAELPPLTRLLFAGLWCIADREGRLEDRPARIKVDLLPYDKCSVDKMLQALHGQEFILRYTSGGAKYIQVLTFTKHQNPHVKEGPSTIPAPGKHSAEPGANPVQSTVLAPEIPERARLIPDSGFPISKTSVVQNPDIDARAVPKANNASGKKENGKTERWDATDQGTDAKGRELNTPAKTGETYFDYRRRLWRIINERSRASH